MPQLTLAQIKKLNKEHGGRFFDPKVMQTFRSQVEEQVWEGPGGVYFVSSEDYSLNGTDRFWTVRRVDTETWGITTWRQDGRHLRVTREVARAMAKALALLEPHDPPHWND